MSKASTKKGKKNKADEKTAVEEPVKRKLVKMDTEEQKLGNLVEKEAEHDNAECSDEEKDADTADTEIVPPSVNEDLREDGYALEPPLTSDEYVDGLLKAVDATTIFKNKYFPKLKKQIRKVQGYMVPWYDEPTCTNERFCIDDGCDTSNRYPAWAWCLMRCETQGNSRFDGRVVATFEPVSRRIYVMWDCRRFGKPIPFQCFDKFQTDEAQQMDVNRVAIEIKTRLEQIAAQGGGLSDLSD